jgi:hypothetical protein
MLPFERKVPLAGGRSVLIASTGDSDVVELRAPGGLVEIRIEVTASGPVLRADGLKLALQAADSIDIDCRRLTLSASEAIALESKGTVDVTSAAGVEIESTDGDVRVRGKTIHLN